MSQSEEAAPLDFVRQMIADELAAGTYDRLATRFPPEPNGYLHIGHAKSICLNFGIAQAFADQAPKGAACHLRFDDTNPIKEEQHYIEAIKKDVAWLGFDWGEHEHYTSDYFDQLYDWALQLIDQGVAYVDDQTGEQIRDTRGTLTAPGVASPYRDRSPEENRTLFEKMRAGDFPDGHCTLRAKIDMASPNLSLRDPIMYRILHATHPRTGDAWCIYPMYDWAHGQSDAIERITHSLCTLEFEAHRPLYEWFIQSLDLFPSKQREFARLNLTHTVMSKRRLKQLVDEGHVQGWDDPRMPTISGMRRRGYPAEAIRDFCEGVGLSKRRQVIDLTRLEYHVRQTLNRTAKRVMAVVDPLKVVIENYPEGQNETLPAVNNPENPDDGVRQVPFEREIYIERADFMEDPPKKFFRLGIGREVRLRYAYMVTCTSVVKDEAGQIVEVRCTYDPETRGGNAPDGRKVKGTIHWVAASTAQSATVRQYHHLFDRADPDDLTDLPEGSDWLDNVNQQSLKVVDQVMVEPFAADLPIGTTCQFERLGYYHVDPDTNDQRTVFNHTVALREASGKKKAKQK